MAEIKGVLLNAWIQFLKSRYGQDEFVRGTQKLPRELQQPLVAGFLDSSWYPFESQVPLVEITRALASPADHNISFEMGRFMADYAFDKVYKGLLTRETRKLVRNGWLEDSLFKGLRTMKSEMIDESTCLIRYYYEPGMKPAFGMCASTIGFCVRQAELAGQKNVRVTHPKTKCAIGGNECCEVLIEW
jgi:hypothetical protein